MAPKRDTIASMSAGRCRCADGAAEVTVGTSMSSEESRKRLDELAFSGEFSWSSTLIEIVGTVALAEAGRCAMVHKEREKRSKRAAEQERSGSWECR